MVNKVAAAIVFFIMSSTCSSAAPIRALDGTPSGLALAARSAIGGIRVIVKDLSGI
jgi:hypothetical protein